MDVEEQVARLRGEVTAAQRLHASAVAGLALAEAREAAAAEELRAEFGVTGPGEAAVLAARLEREVAAEAAEVRGHLARAGAAQ